MENLNSDGGGFHLECVALGGALVISTAWASAGVICHFNKSGIYAAAL
jgi:hypothetical protein